MSEDTKTVAKVGVRKRMVRYLKEIRVELRKVIWPTKSQLVNNTISVLASCLIIGAVIWVADFALGHLLSIFGNS
ncbi:MAG: preprotein translocase subunit SecE [Oscillospiraceae bacterium]|nr:preprotein translocase subunit SecE [Oscillospiraceae bacterium]